MKYFFVAFFLVLAAGFNLNAQSSDDLWSQANQSYQAGHFEQAISNYQQVLENGANSAMLFHNLGNAYYRKGEIGKAVLNYERALLIAPDDNNSRQNLKLIFDQQEDPIIPVDPFFVNNWWKNIFRFFNPATWSIFSIVFMLLTFIGIGNLLFKSNLKKVGLWKFGVLIVSFLSILTTTCGYCSYKYIYKNPYAVVMNSDSWLHDGADSRSEKVKDLYPGAKVFIIDQIGPWLKVSTLDKEHGWIEESSLERISLQKP